jgi:hypothetical protein
MSQHLESYYNKVDVRNPIITKHNVWSPIIANFSARSGGGIFGREIDFGMKRVGVADL